MQLPEPTPDPANPSTLVDLDRYPLLQPESLSYEAIVTAARSQVAQLGAAEIPGFITPAGVERLVNDADALAAPRITPAGRARPTSSSPTSRSRRITPA